MIHISRLGSNPHAGLSGAGDALVPGGGNDVGLQLTVDIDVDGQHGELRSQLRHSAVRGIRTSPDGRSRRS